MPSPRALARHRSVYRALLRLYPRSFRSGYGEPMAQLFADRFRDVGARAWLRTLPDLVRTVPTQRAEAVMDRLSPGARVAALALIVAGGVVVTLGIGAGSVPFVALALVALLVSQRRLFASVGLGDRAPLGRALVQAWWAPVAGLLGGATLLFGIGTVFEASNWGGRIVGSSLLIGFGLAMVFGLKRRPFDRQAGNAAILVSTIPALLLFWLIVPTVLALVVWVGVLSSGFSDQPVVAATP